MPTEADSPNTLGPAVRNRSVSAGDVPESLARRYFTDGRGGGGLGFYVDARVQAPAFRDRGRQLETARNDPNAIRDMVAIARHRQWTIVTVRGTGDFRREAWLVGQAAGIDVRGYQATERDVQELERRRTAQRRRATLTAEQSEQPQDKRRPSASQNMRVVETVVRARVTERSAQDRILAAARERLAQWQELGAQVGPMAGRASTREPNHAERQRSR